MDEQREVSEIVTDVPLTFFRHFNVICVRASCDGGCRQSKGKSGTGWVIEVSNDLGQKWQVWARGWSYLHGNLDAIETEILALEDLVYTLHDMIHELR